MQRAHPAAVSTQLLIFNGQHVGNMSPSRALRSPTRVGVVGLGNTGSLAFGSGDKRGEEPPSQGGSGGSNPLGATTLNPPVSRGVSVCS